jgi:hypothetical protein
MTGFDPPSAHHDARANARLRGLMGETMRVIAEYDFDQATPLLRFFIHGAPHRRIHQAVLKQYRRALWDAGREAQIPAPLRNNVELSANFISPTSPDLDNLLTALFQALDGKCGQGPTLLADDRQIVFVKNLGLMFP